MATRKTASGSEKSASRLLDAITGKAAKITVAITAVVGLLAAIENMFGGFEKLASHVAALSHGTETACFTAELEVQPPSVPVARWNQVRFHLTGWNKCGATLSVHVAYKAQGDALRIEPPFKGPDQPTCAGYDNPDCWELITLDNGKQVDQDLVLPKLIQLGTLANPAKVVINWIVYNTETKKQVRAGVAEIAVSKSE